MSNIREAGGKWLVRRKHTVPTVVSFVGPHQARNAHKDNRYLSRCHQACVMLPSFLVCGPYQLLCQAKVANLNIFRLMRGKH
jgi:hypothetical protein